MSFSISINCKKEEVEERLASQTGPESVKEYIRQSVAPLKSESVVVTAYGHLHSGEEHDYNVSTAHIEVKPA